MSKSRRYEILLPLKFNDGQPVPDSLIRTTLLELEQKFDAVSWETQVIRGAWHHGGRQYRDEVFRVFVDVAEHAQTRQFFVRYKQKLRARFKQIDIWMTTYPMDVL